MSILDVSLIEGMTFAELTRTYDDEKDKKIQRTEFANKYIISICNDNSMRNYGMVDQHGNPVDNNIHTWFEIRYFDEDGYLVTWSDLSGEYVTNTDGEYILDENGNKIKETRLTDCKVYSYVGDNEQRTLAFPEIILAPAFFEGNGMDRSIGITERLTFVYEGDQEKIIDLWFRQATILNELQENNPVWSLINIIDSDSGQPSTFNCTYMTNIILQEYLGINFFEGIETPLGMRGLIFQIQLMQQITEESNCFEWEIDSDTHSPNRLNWYANYQGDWRNKTITYYNNQYYTTLLYAAMNLDSEQIESIANSWAPHTANTIQQLRDYKEQEIRKKHAHENLTDAEFTELFTANDIWRYCENYDTQMASKNKGLY